MAVHPALARPGDARARSPDPSRRATIASPRTTARRPRPSGCWRRTRAGRSAADAARRRGETPARRCDRRAPRSRRAERGCRRSLRSRRAHRAHWRDRSRTPLQPSHPFTPYKVCQDPCQFNMCIEPATTSASAAAAGRGCIGMITQQPADQGVRAPRPATGRPRRGRRRRCPRRARRWSRCSRRRSPGHPPRPAARRWRRWW